MDQKMNKTEDVRRAVAQEMNEVYMMGYDVWSDGLEQTSYLKSCAESSKYQKGVWYVLSGKQELLSSLIVYDFGNGRYGIGSLATPLSLRGLGYASQLMTSILSILENEMGAQQIYLYSDIQPEFYEQFGFQRMPAHQQKYPHSVCMQRSLSERNSEFVPNYF